MKTNKIQKFIFVPGKIKQWKKFDYNNFTLWISGINKKAKFEKDKKYYLNEEEKINKSKIIKILGDQFGIIIFHDSWVFFSYRPNKKFSYILEG